MLISEVGGECLTTVAPQTQVDGILMVHRCSPVAVGFQNVFLVSVQG